MLCTGRCVNLILGPGRPSQVLNTVVSLDAIDMVYLVLAIRIRNECKGDEAMNRIRMLYPIRSQTNNPISTIHQCRTQDLHPIMFNTSHQPRIADLVIGVVVDDTPLLHCGRVSLTMLFSFLLAVHYA